jgi:hypothetical protein
MASDFANLLALSDFAIETIRVAVYERASQFSRLIRQRESTEEVADRLMAFVGSDHWRITALDVALRQMDRRGSVDEAIAIAEKIVAWVKTEKKATVVKEAGLSLDDLDEPKPRKRGRPKKR